MSPLAGAVFVALAITLAKRPLVKIGPDEPLAPTTPRRPDERGLLLRFRVVLCGLALAAGWVVLGGLVGLGAGLLAGVVSWRALATVESPAAARRREELRRDLPAAVHLLGACLSAGAATSAALSTVAEAMPGAVGDEFALVQRRLQWGVDPAQVWRTMGGPLEPLGRCMARAYVSGSSVQLSIQRLALELRNETRARAEGMARTIEVRAAVPLGLCFLPAFVLLGVVPMTAGLFAAMDLFR